MKRTIICMNEEELQGFQGKGQRGFSVRLAFQVEEATEVEARQAYKNFFDLLKTGALQFRAFSVKDGQPPLFVQDVVPPKPTVVSTSLLDEFDDWLGTHALASRNGRSAGLWALSGVERTVIDNTGILDARSVLVGAASWVAPVPQSLGLAYVLRLDYEGPEDIVFLPFIDGQLVPVDYTDNVSDADDVLFSYTSDKVQLCRSNRARRPERGDMLIDPQSGFVQFGENDGEQESYRALARIEQRAGSLFTGVFAVSEVEWKDEPSLLQRLRRQGWRAVSTLATSLDTLVLSLMMPNAGDSARSPREGALLGPVLNLFIERLNNAGLSAELPRSLLRDAIRNGIQSALAHSDKKAYIEILLDICRPAGGQDSPLYKLLRASANPVLASWKTLGELSLETFRSELVSLQQASLSEDGFEATALRLLRRLPGAALDTVHVAVNAGRDEASRIDVRQAFALALDDFEALLRTGFNGADAARQSVGKLICDTVLRQLKVDARSLKEATETLGFWKYRLGVESLDAMPEAARSLIGCVPVLPTIRDFFAADLEAPAEMAEDSDAQIAISKAAERMQEDVLRELFVPVTSRFLPDLAPSPLTIQLTVDPVTDDEELDLFSAAFSGVALVLRRTFDDKAYSPWAYANLADFHPLSNPPPTALEDAITVQPLPTTINDGRRSLFLHYDGLPFASSAFDQSLPGAGADPLGKAFFGTDYPGTLKDGYQPLPTLAYGARYEICAHVVGRSGSLPAALQGSQPWVPKAAISVDGAPTLKLVYSRRTAIGRTTISDGGATQRLGLLPPGLQPLSADYPRLGLHSAAKLPLDLFRQVDGNGAWHLGNDAVSRDIVLEDLRYSGPVDGKLEIEVWYGTQLCVFKQELAVGTSISTRVSISQEADAIKVGFARDEGTFTKTKGLDSLWLRLKLHAAASASLSLVDPAASAQRTAGQGPKADNLLLLGASIPGVAQGGWRSPFDKGTSLSVNFPRVPYSDFVRWIANPTRRGEVFNGLDNTKDQVKSFLCLLEAANIDRSHDLELGKLLDALLDPAVSSLRLEVVVLDGLLADPRLLGQEAELKPVEVRQLPIPSLGQMLQSIGNLVELLAKGRIKEILKLLEPKCRHLVSVSSFDLNAGLALLFNDSLLQVPAGACVQLLARPQVRSTLFSVGLPVIDSRLEALSIGRDGDLVVFEGARVLVESMPGPLSVPVGNAKGMLASREEWTSLALGLISYEPVGSARSYTLKAGGTFKADDTDATNLKAWRWRQLGAVTVLTQRWRFDGKPIYAWINPKADDSSLTAPGCASRKLKADDQLARFEQQTFAGRDRDGQSSTVNLLPGPAVTPLHTAHWEKPSATVFRHRFTLHSRYTPAFERDTDGQCQAWSASLEQAWLRVAMLAEASRIELTRPQLRALIPLTQSPEEGAGLTPPLMAILQERPFDYGGLADRVIAEIRSGIGYELPATQENAQASVVPADIRKEIGRDPRLAYEPFDQATGQGVLLSVEGPIGLTFESDAVAAPAFPNSALVLDPVSLKIGKEDASPPETLDLEEHFLSVGLRRYLHPHWLVSTIKKQSPPDFSSNCWIQFPATQATLTIGQDAGLIRVVEFDASEHREVTLDWRVLDPTVSVGKRMKLVSLPLVNDLAGWQCALLHTPVNDRRAVLAVFLVPPETLEEERGAGNAPKLLASIEWNLPAGFGWDHLVLEAKEAKDLWSCAVGVSQTTAMHWARTNRNFATVMAAGEKLLETGKSWPVAALQARLKKTGNAKKTEETLEFATLTAPADSLWLRPTQAAQPYPTHTQRHLALLFSEMRSGLGRSLERPTALHMLGAKSLTMAEGTVPDVSNTRVRVIEFETPAIILGHGSDAIPDHYKYGYLDLVATGVVPAKPENKVLLSLNLRVIASSTTRTELTELRLHLRPESTTASSGNVLVLHPTVGKELATLDVGLKLDAQGAAEVLKPSQVYALGQRDEIAAEWLGAPWGTDATTGIKGLAITVESATFKDGNPRELWLEVSMLASSYDDKNHVHHGFNSTLDLDWFFGTDPLSSDTAANADELRELKEVQARIISVSPGISVTG